MTLHVVGLNHHRAPVEVRERLAVPESDLGRVLEGAVRIEGVREAVAVSTCNRVELYLAAGAELTLETVCGYLAGHGGLPPETLYPHLFINRHLDAATHLFRVTAGLDALVVGETEIAAQVKRSYAAAQDHGRTGPLLNTVFQRAFHAAKRVHTETRLSQGRISVPSIAVELVRRVFHDLAKKTVLLLGAGEMGRLTARHLRDAGVGRVLICNRTLSRAEDLGTEVGGVVVPFDQVDAYLPMADVLVCTTSAREPVLGYERVQAALRARKQAPTLALDLAVPRDVDPRAATLTGLYLYDIDDLGQIVAANLEKRRGEMDHAESIVGEEAGQFQRWYEGRDMEAAIRSIHSYASEVQAREIERTLARLGDADPRLKNEVASLAQRIVSKITARPIEALRREADSGDGVMAAQVARRLFNGAPQETRSAEGGAPTESKS